MKPIKTLTAVLTLACAASAHAEFRTGNKLLDEMNSSSAYSNGVALGFIMGVVDASGGTNHCPPPTVTAGQVQDMVKATLIDAPAVRHMSASMIIEYTLNKAWPCKKSSAL